MSQENFQHIFLQQISNKNMTIIEKFFAVNKDYISNSKTNTNPKQSIKIQFKKLPNGIIQSSLGAKFREQNLEMNKILGGSKLPQLECTSLLIGKNANRKFKPQQKSKIDEQTKNNTINVSENDDDTPISKATSQKTDDTIKKYESQHLPIIKVTIKQPIPILKEIIVKQPKQRPKIRSSMHFSTAKPSSIKLNSKNILNFDNKLQKGYMSYEKQSRDFWAQKNSNLIVKSKLEIPSVSARYYVVLDIENLCVLASKNRDSEIQIASLSKIMTCYLCIIAAKKYSIDLKNYTVRVSDIINDVPGTSAELQPGDILTLDNLLYGLMLPSGNDASMVIADCIGKVIQKHKKKPTKKTPYETFISHMNLLASQLNLQQTFSNSSGLSFTPNYSTPIAIATLTSLALRNNYFRTIINTKTFQIQIKNQRYGLTRKLAWKNTNKLLWKGWEGVKTGTTQNAGHCLAALKNKYLICVFDCQNTNKRFSECVRIYQHLQKILH